MKTFLSLITMLFFTSIVSAQDITATVVDKATNTPIPFVSVQTAAYKGVISNEEGEFIIDLIDVSNNTITLSCMGYETLMISIEDLKASNYLVKLNPAINELDTVYLTNSRPNVDSIIARARQNLKKNYPSHALTYKIFYRESETIDFEHLDFEVEKASHFKKRQLEEANEQLQKMGQDIMNGNITYFTDFAGRLHVLDSAQKKLMVEKATKILNAKENISLETIQDNAQKIVLRYLDTTQTYKLKTGLFKVEDSLSLTEESQSKKKPNELEVENLRNTTIGVLNKSKLGNSSMLNVILNSDNYEYKLMNANLINGEMVYRIAYEPKRSRANYTGDLYISEDTYAILKMDYRYAKGKRGEKVNLKLILGIKYIENISQGTIIFEKNRQDFYTPRYIKSESGEYFYLHRPLKFIENSSNRNKTSFDVKIAGNSFNRKELLLSDVSSIATEVFANLEEEKTIPYESLRKYNADIWSGQETLAPNTELKTFDAGN